MKDPLILGAALELSNAVLYDQYRERAELINQAGEPAISTP